MTTPTIRRECFLIVKRGVLMSANEKTWGDWAGESTANLIDESLRAGLAVLWRAYLCAEDAGVNVWDFALRTGRLYEAGVTSSDLRWLVAKGFAEHGQETSGYDDPHRSFRRSNGYFFNDHTCLILTPSGAALAEHVFRETGQWPQPTLSALAAVAAGHVGLCAHQSAEKGGKIVKLPAFTLE